MKDACKERRLCAQPVVVEDVRVITETEFGQVVVKPFRTRQLPLALLATADGSKIRQINFSHGKLIAPS